MLKQRSGWGKAEARSARLQKTFPLSKVCYPHFTLKLNLSKRQLQIPGNVEKAQNTIQISFANVEAVIVHFGFKKSKVGDFKSSPYGH